MKYIPSGILLAASIVLLNPVYAPIWFWFAWIGFCAVLIVTLMDAEDRREFFLSEKPRANGTNR